MVATMRSAGCDAISRGISLGHTIIPRLAAYDGGGRLELGFFEQTGASIYSVDAGGALTLLRTIPGLVGGSVYGPAVADINQDGIADVVTQDAQKCLQVWLGPTLATALPGPCADRIFADWDVRDIDGDGKVDLLGVDANHWFYSFGGHGDGSFDAPELAARFCSDSYLRFMRAPRKNATAPDPMILDCASSVEVVTWSSGIPSTDTTITSTGGLLGDLDGDGLPDLITRAPGGLTALYGGALAGYFDPHPSASVASPGDPLGGNAAVTPILARGHFAGGLAVAGWMDTVRLLASDGARLAPTSQVVTLGADTPSWDAVLRLAACDLDGDGNDDLIAQMQTADAQGHGLTYFQAVFADASGLRPGPLFGVQSDALTGSVDGRFQVGDLDGDHRCDVVLVRSTSQRDPYY
jgi:hypothetical protein